MRSDSQKTIPLDHLSLDIGSFLAALRRLAKLCELTDIGYTIIEYENTKYYGGRRRVGSSNNNII